MRVDVPLQLECSDGNVGRSSETYRRHFIMLINDYVRVFVGTALLYRGQHGQSVRWFRDRD